MSAPWSSLLLDQSTWDLVIDARANIAVAAPPYAIAQDVSCSIRTFFGECWYDTTRGVPYQTKILGKAPPLNVFQEYMVAAGLQVDGVTSALCTLQSFVGRRVSGQLQFTDINGNTQTIGIGS